LQKKIRYGNFFAHSRLKTFLFHKSFPRSILFSSSDSVDGYCFFRFCFKKFLNLVFYFFDSLRYIKLAFSTFQLTLNEHFVSCLLALTQSIQSRVYETVACPSVRPSVPSFSRRTLLRGLLLWARRARDIDRLLHGRRSAAAALQQCGQCHVVS